MVTNPADLGPASENYKVLSLCIFGICFQNSAKLGFHAVEFIQTSQVINHQTQPPFKNLIDFQIFEVLGRPPIEY